ncbi:MAG: SAF domain-containing protein [Campylobacterota bacterium]|nr:SAF domain-containing protein [Campylobacterota bacterium]
MEFNKQIAIMLALLSLLLSALGGAYYFYDQNQQTLKSNSQVRAVFIAAKDIKKNVIVKAEDIKQVNIAKKYILTTPLLKKEIIGKVAKENIYKNDMFRKEKLAKKIDTGESDLMVYNNNSYNIDFGLFVNPNYSLSQGDYIKIVSVYPGSKAKDNMKYNVQYVVKDVKVIGFLEKGKTVAKCFRSVKKQVKSKKKGEQPKVETVIVYANELVLDIQSKVLLSLIEDYNKGKQLWMVKTKAPKTNKKIEKRIVEPKVVSTKKSKSGKKTKRRVYPVKWYIPRNISRTASGTIRYADVDKVAQSQKATIKTSFTEQCKVKDKLLIGISRNVYLRKVSSLKGKIKRVVYRNYLIPYKRKVSQNWYEACDGTFVHKNEVSEISLTNANKKLQWKRN